MRRHRSLPICLALLLTLVAGASDVSARIYHWIDNAGREHFSDRVENVPAAYRDQIGAGEEEVERRGTVNIIQGMSQPAPQALAEAGEAVEPSSPPPAVQEVEEIAQLPGLAADPSEMLERLKGPVIAFAVLLTLVVCGFLFAFLSMVLLLGCRLVGQESPGFKKAYGIVIVQFLAGLVASPAVVVVFGQPSIADLGAVLRLQAINTGILLLLHSAVLRGMLCESIGKSIGLAIVVNLVLLGLAVLLFLGAMMCAGGAALLGAG
jgi:hypothetical protein